MTLPFVTITDGSSKALKQVKLGRVRPLATLDTPSHRILVLPDGSHKAVVKLSYHLRSKKATIALPESLDYFAKAMDSVKRMYRNDQKGCCVISSSWHQYGLWTGSESGTPVQCTDAEIDRDYQTICGPGDNGCVITRVLDVMKSKGLVTAGKAHKLDNYVAIDWTNRQEVETALYLFGSLKLGINLPQDWTCTNCTWDVTRSQIVGGHDVPAGGFSSQGVKIATWGGTCVITWPAFLSKTWNEECYAELAPDWYSNANLAPCGVDAVSLKKDLDLLGSGVIPPLPDPNPTPTPVPPPPPGPTPTPAPTPWFTLNFVRNTPKGKKVSFITQVDTPKGVYDAYPETPTRGALVEEHE